MGECALIVVPAAFTYTTGSAHWEVLLRARAIENQCYVLAAAQGGLHLNGRRTFGHSMLVDPWGAVKDVLAEGEGVVSGQHRRRLPRRRARKLAGAQAPQAVSRCEQAVYGTMPASPLKDLHNDTI